MASKMTFQFLDVGMGDGTLVQIRPEGQAYDTLVLIDFGEDKSPKKVALSDALLYLRDTINTNSLARPGLDQPLVDYLFLTHPDKDHFNRIPELWEAKFPGFPGKELRFGEVYVGGKLTEYPIMGELAKHAGLVSELKSNYHTPVNNQTVAADFTIGDVKVYVLSANYPSLGTASKNPRSIVLMFDLDGSKVITQGDAEEATENAILTHFATMPASFLEVVGLKLGHHGSRKATSTAWVSRLKPKAIFASGDFFWAHPYCEPICRVVNGNTLGLAPDQDLWYCCGNSGAYYNNHYYKAVCMNLWYYVKSPNGEYLTENLQSQPKWLENGVTYGVQWALKIERGVRPELLRTRAPLPYDVLRIPPGWNCSNSLFALDDSGEPTDALAALPVAADRF